MSADEYRCGMCGMELLSPNQFNTERIYNTVKRYEDEAAKTRLIAVRCGECKKLPYLLKEGEPHKIELVGIRNEPVIPVGRDYNYYPLGIGHLLEIYVSSVTDDLIARLRREPFEIGFLVEEDVNLIAVAYRYGKHDFKLAAYSWHILSEGTRAIPPLAPISESERKFTVAFIDTRNGKYIVIRKMKMSPEFALKFHSAFQEHIKHEARDLKETLEGIDHLYGLSFENQIESLLTARCLLE